MIMEKNWAIILAAGNGSRMGESTRGIPKQFFDWNGFPLYWHSLIAFAHSGCVDGVILAFPEKELDSEKVRIEKLLKRNDPGILIKVVSGGARRQDSVSNSIKLLPQDCTRVFIHDGARPFLKASLIFRLNDSFNNELDGIVPILRITDTVKEIQQENFINRTLDRNSLVCVQTPQVFNAEKFRQVCTIEKDVTDDAALMEEMGYKIGFIEGDMENRKITVPSDLTYLKRNHKGETRTGFGYDVHKFGGSRPLKLGGVSIPFNKGVEAHSDGDVLLHALIDALLGSAGLGDIGEHFPDSDPSFDNISSSILLDETLSMLSEKQLRVVNTDITIVAQRPNLKIWKQSIIRNISRLLNISEDRVSVKATTEEGLGFTGACEGIKAYAVVTVN